MTLSKIKEILANNFNITEDVTPDTKISDLGIDSMKFLEVLFYVEEEYNIELDPSVFKSVRTIQDLIENIEQNN